MISVAKPHYILFIISMCLYLLSIQMDKNFVKYIIFHHVHVNLNSKA